MNTTMATRKIRNWWWTDFRVNGARYRKRSPENSAAGARAFENVLRQKLARGESLDAPEAKPDEKRFREFASEWFEAYVKTNNKPSEQSTKESILRVHLNPWFGDITLKQLSAQHIEEYKAEKLRSGLSAKTINNHLTILRKCLVTAQDWNLVENVPRFYWLKTMLPPVTFLTQAESSSLLSDNPESMWGRMILLGLRSGLRIGEILALDWSDVDLGRNIMTVRRSLSMNILGTPKSNRIRHIPLTADVVVSLQEEWHKLKAPAQGFIFKDRNGKAYNRFQATIALHRQCKRAGVRQIGWHTLRHTFATQLIARGAPMRAVQELLGHSTILMTQRYAHVAPTTLMSVVALLEPDTSSVPRLHGQPVGNARTRDRNEVSLCTNYFAN